MTLDNNTCYLPNARKLMPLGFAPQAPDQFGRRVYESATCLIAVDCAPGASGEVTIWTTLKNGGAGRRFTGLLASEAFFDLLLLGVGFKAQTPYTMPEHSAEEWAQKLGLSLD